MRRLEGINGKILTKQDMFFRKFQFKIVTQTVILNIILVHLMPLKICSIRVEYALRQACLLLKMYIKCK